MDSRGHQGTEHPWRELLGEPGRDRQALIFSADNFLQELDARTGASIATFGTDGRVDLRAGLDRDPERINQQSRLPGKVFENLVIHVYDSASGKQLWETPLGGSTTGSPSMYERAGRQYLLVTAAGADQGSGPGGSVPAAGPTGLVAYALPRN